MSQKTNSEYDIRFDSTNEEKAKKIAFNAKVERNFGSPRIEWVKQ